MSRIPTPRLPRGIPSESWFPGWLAGVLVMVVTMGCDERGGASQPNRVNVEATVSGWRIGEEKTTIGGGGGPDDPLFYGIRQVVEVASGRFFVLNVGDGRIAAFDPDGRSVGDLGRKGSGPGEFLLPVAMTLLRQDQLLVLDPQATRVSEFDASTLEFVSSASVDLSYGMPMDIACCASDGDPLLGFQPLPGLSTDSTPMVGSFDFGSGAVTPIVSLKAHRRIPLTYIANNQRVTQPVDAPFSPKATWAATHDGAVYWGDGESYVVRRHGAESEGAVAIRGGVGPAEAVTAEDRSRFLDDLPEEVDAASIQISFPSEKPFFTTIRSDPTGVIWVRSAAFPNEESWDVWTPSGERLGAVRLPIGWRLVGISRRALYAVQTSQLGEERLHKVTLAR